MPTPLNLKHKAVHELLLLYLQERVLHYTCFDLRDYEKVLYNHDLNDGVELMQHLKLLSAPHLLHACLRNEGVSEKLQSGLL